MSQRAESDGPVFSGQDLHLYNPVPVHIETSTCLERDVLIRMNTDRAGSCVSMMEITPEKAIEFAERLIDVAREVIVRRVLRD